MVKLLLFVFLIKESIELKYSACIKIKLQPVFALNKREAFYKMRKLMKQERKVACFEYVGVKTMKELKRFSAKNKRIEIESGLRKTFLVKVK